MKTCFKTSKKSLLAGALIFIAALFLTSCENFLKGGSIRKDLEEAIEIANTNPVTIYIEAEEGSGTVTPTQLRLKKKETFDLRYKPASSWRFIKWEVRDRNTKEVVTDVIQFDDETALETKGRVLDPREGLEIYAKAVILPEVVSVVPDPGSTISSYKSIVFTFNTPVDDTDATETASVFNYNNILITSDGKDVSSFFEKPYFNSDKTVLTILPKAKDIYDYINLYHMTVLDLKITLSDRIVVTQGDQEVGLTQNSNTSFALHYRPVIETVDPLQVGDLIVSRKEITKENLEDFPESDKFFKITDPNSSATPAEKIMRNRVADKIFIYGKYFDDDSGINAVTVKEIRKYDLGGHSETPLTDTVRAPVKYNGENALFIHDGKYTEFFIEHEVMTKEGAVKLDVFVSDSCGNEASDSLYVFKVGPDCYRKFTIQNRSLLTDFYSENFNETIKTIRINHDFEEKVYFKDRTEVDTSDLKIYCLYNNKVASAETQFSPFNRNVTWHNNQTDEDITEVEKGWEYKLDIPSVAGLKFTILTVDDIGNTFQKEFSFPSEPAVLVSGNDIDRKKAYIYPQENTTQYFIINSESSIEDRIDVRNALEYGFPRDSYEYLNHRAEYWIIPCNEYSSSNDVSYNLYGPKSSKSFKVNTENGSLSQKVSLKTDPQFNIVPGKGIAELYFTLADNSWTNFDLIYFDKIIGSSTYENNIIPKGSFLVKHDISGDCDELYTNDITLKIYGIQNGKKSEALEKTIVTSKDSQGNSVAKGTYDITPPETNIFSRTSADYYTIQFKTGSGSNESDLDKLYIIERDGTEKLYTELTTSQNGYSQQLKIPAAVLVNEVNEGGKWKLKATDEKGNACIFEVPKATIYEDYKFGDLIKSNSNWKVVLDYFEVYGVFQSTYCLTEDGWAWKETTIKKSDNDINASSVGEFELMDNSFVKMSYLKILSSEICYYNYGYYYTNTSVQPSGDFNYIQKLSDSEFMITSDVPTLVHTIKTKIPYRECKKWTADDWEAHLAPIGDRVMPFTESNNTPRKYRVPVDEIDSGECYVVITYFANSNKQNKAYKLEPHMTEVMIKP
ncbi:MAG: hypothetical protein IKX70_04645 [Treponema sp.]|nr:hypothetical protein [Treponema sp.]MBR5032935.1 hypothetical protein [Treponema sp.]